MQTRRLSNQLILATNTYLAENGMIVSRGTTVRATGVNNGYSFLV